MEIILNKRFKFWDSLEKIERIFIEYNIEKYHIHLDRIQSPNKDNQHLFQTSHGIIKVNHLPRSLLENSDLRRDLLKEIKEISSSLKISYEEKKLVVTDR